ncbi:hypothetical protein HYU19_01070 [Candidatus Woesearchaeota archaeon]|nr:hypothetical protein [Candidatus Woesearchaeota archaeon]
MILIRTNHDTQTSYLYLSCNEVIKLAEKNGLTVVKLEGKDISEKTLRSRIKNKHPKFIFFNGHGNATGLLDNDKTPFITVTSSDVFKNTVSFTRACDCLKELGKNAVKNGCKTFIGYKRKFWIARHHKYECQPLKDNIAKPILECSNLVAEELIKGKTVKEAIKKSHEKSADYILNLIYSKDPLAVASLQALVANDEALGFEGEGMARL